MALFKHFAIIYCERHSNWPIQDIYFTWKTGFNTINIHSHWIMNISSACWFTQNNWCVREIYGLFFVSLAPPWWYISCWMNAYFYITVQNRSEWSKIVHILLWSVRFQLKQFWRHLFESLSTMHGHSSTLTHTLFDWSRILRRRRQQQRLDKVENHCCKQSGDLFIHLIGITFFTNEIQLFR